MKINMRNIIFLLPFLLLNKVYADRQVKEIVLKTESSLLELSPAVVEAQKKVIQSFSEQLISGMLSADQFKSKKKKLNQFVLNSWTKYISQIKVQSSKKMKDHFEIEFKLVYSEDILKELLTEKNFLAETDRFLKILPLIEWIDEDHKVIYQWWRHRLTKEKLDLYTKSSAAYEQMKSSFFEQGILLSNPLDQKFYDILPDPVKVDQLTDENLILISRLTKHQLLALGKIKFTPQNENEKPQVSIEFDIMNPLTNKKILSFERKILDKSSWFESVNLQNDLIEELKTSSPDLASQIYENWQRGTLNSQTYRLDILGQFNLEDQTKIKNLLQTKIPEIRMIKERTFSLKQLSYEVETQLTSQSLSEKITKIPDLKLKKDTTADLHFVREPTHE